MTSHHAYLERSAAARRFGVPPERVARRVQWLPDMLAEFVLSYLEAVRARGAFLVKDSRMEPADRLAFFAFQRDYEKWRKERLSN